MVDDYQLDPDELLKAVQKEETQKKLGQLKIFFGMSAGVGKTYAMLEEAQRRFKEGVNIVAGTINTHGRKETEMLLKGLPLIPEKWVKYRDTVFEEMDLETILEQKPTIVLVDELAHTNVPGSRHAKRWQDVIEILDNGIHVYTTLNVQHIESRKDLVESITGIQIRETVPDLLLERATTIELIDLPATELLQRMQEGKVYLGNQSKLAAQNFFKEDTLMALREISLRFTAEKVDHDLHAILSPGKGWKTREKLMVAVSPSPSSMQLIRTTRRRAFELDAAWVAIHVDTGQTLSDEDQTRLTNHLTLAQELGAEVVTTHDLDIATALNSTAKHKNITQLVIGRPGTRSVYDIFRKSLIERLEKDNQHLDLLILRKEEVPKEKSPGIRSFLPTFQSSIYEYIFSAFVVLGFSLFGYFINPVLGYKGIGFIFLLSILLLSFLTGPGPIFFAAALSTLAWNFILIPPYFTFSLDTTEDIAQTLLYFCTSATIGMLTSHIRKQDLFLKMRENKLQHLYEIEREIANATNFQYLRLNVTTRLQSIFNGQFDILIKGGNNQLVFDSQLSLLKEDKEQAAAHWVFQNGKMAGWSTSTLPFAKGLYLPIRFSQTTIGILVFFPAKERLPSIDEMNFLQTVAEQLGIYLERHLFEERVVSQIYTNQVEKLQTSILSSVSQAFYQPLNQIFESIRELQSTVPNARDNSLVQTITQASQNLKLIIDNFISMAELESGFVHFEKKSLDIKLFAEECVADNKLFMGDHSIVTFLPENPFFLSFDPYLMKVALKNILTNAMLSSFPKKPLTLTGKVESGTFKLSVTNEGPGIPPEVLPTLFEKPQQFSDLAAKGKENRLNLANAKYVMDIHQGQLNVQSNEKGTTFSLLLPI